MESTPPALTEQQRRNAAVADAWERFAPHRARVMELLLAAAEGRTFPRLALLGAGNCNDVDLKRLLERYQAIDLVDVDRDALEQGLARQGVREDPAIELHAGIDLLELSRSGIGSIPDVVASLCVLSQLIEHAAQGSGANQPNEQLPLVQAARLRHLQLLTDMLASGGEAILVTDFVSSETLPALQTATEERLPALLAAAIRQQNFFTGLNPAVVLDLFRSDASLKDRMEAIKIHGPWVWNLGPRVYGVYAVSWRRVA